MSVDAAPPESAGRSRPAESAGASRPGAASRRSRAGRAYADLPDRTEPAAAQQWGPPEERGRTEIADQVVEKAAAQALREVEQAGGVARRWLGVRVGRGRDGDAPRVTAHRHGDMVTLHMTVSVGYPAPVRQVTRQVREHVTHRLQELTGLVVRQVDIDVARLVPADDDTGRRTGPE